MRDLIIKYFALFYHTKVFGKTYSPMRAITPCVIIFCLAGLYTVSHDYGFGPTDWILWGAVVVVFWTAMPFFGLGYFGMFPVKYKDLKDWQQKHQYLNAPELFTMEDTSHLNEERRKLNLRYDIEFNGPENFKNAFVFFLPWLIMLITLILGFFII